MGASTHYNSLMDIMAPVEEITDSLKSFPKEARESGQPQELNDEEQQVARMLGRSRVTYDAVWAAVEKNAPLWTPVLCNSYRRALLLASSATQHRTKAFEVWRRGRMVVIRPIQERRATA